MSRPHIEFAQSQWLPWEPVSSIAHLAGTRARTLSVDSHDGSRSLLVQFPPGWLLRNRECAFDEEIYVLDGELSVNDRSLPVDFFATLPAGYSREFSESPRGAVALVFLGSRPDNAVATPQYGFDHAAWVGRIDVYSDIWPSVPNGWKALDAAENFARLRFLRKDHRTGGETFVVGFPPNWSALTEEVQLSDSEYYLLAGEVKLSGIGKMTPGGYIARPAGKSRPPMVGRDGAVFLVRSHGAPFRATAVGRQEMKHPSGLSCVIPDVMRRQFVAGPFAHSP